MISLVTLIDRLQRLAIGHGSGTPADECPINLFIKRDVYNQDEVDEFLATWNGLTRLREGKRLA